MKIKILSSLIFICLLSQVALSQTYIGGGYAGGIIPTQLSNRDQAEGISFNVIQEIKLGEGRWRLDPGLNVALLYSEIDRNIDAFYSTMISVTPNVAFEIIQKKRVVIAPFAGPYTNWRIVKGGDRNYYDQDNAQFVYESFFTNEVKFGLEFGISANILIGDNFFIKVIPFNYQVNWFDKDDYFEGSYFLKFTSSILIRL